MRTNNIKMLLAFWWLFFYTNATASIHPDYFESITTATGLSDNTVYDILHDTKGYVWFLTDTGLNRYDGLHFRNFPQYQKENASNTLEYIPPHTVRRIYSDGNNLIYQLSSKGGLTCFDIIQECYLDIQFSHQVKPSEITGLYIADEAFIYFTTHEGLFCAEIKKEDNNPKVLQVLWPDSPLVKGKCSLLCGDNKRCLFFCKDGNQVLQYSMSMQKTSQIKLETNANALITSLDVHKDHLWIGRKWENLAIYDYQRETLRTFTDNSQGGIRIPDTFVTKVARVNDCLYYISTWSGLYKIEFAYGKICDSTYNIEYITSKKHSNGSSTEGKMTSLLWDDTQQMLWAGTFGGGAIRLDFNKDVYNRISGQLNTEIQGIEEDSKGYVWLTTERKGIWKSTEREISASSTFVPWTHVSSTESYEMYKDKNGNFWLGDEHAGIIYFDPLTDEVEHYRLSPTGINEFTGNARSFCLDSRERLWVATTQGLILFDHRTKTSTLTVKLEGDIKEVTSVVEDKEGDIWIGTNIGVKLLDMQSGKATLKGDFEEQAGWPCCPVSSIYVNSNNQIFVTYPDRMIRIDGREKYKVETIFTLENGLRSGHLLCMIDDYNGNTWIGSNSGIMTIRNDRNSLYNYSLTGYCNNVCRLRDGRLLWSDSWGLIYFDPMLAKNRPSLKHLFITDLLVNGKAVTVDEEVNGQIILTSTPDHQRKFEFSPANNDFCFLLSDLQYSMMQRKIAYRLLPNTEWHMCTLEEGIHFAGLSKGDYTLQVKLIYPDASEGNLLEIPFIVKGHWWLSLWAIICYLILAGGLGFISYRHIKKGKYKKALPEASLAQTSIEKGIACGKDEDSPVHRLVITNLIKGLRTPLSIIVSPLREAIQEKGLSKGLSTKMLVAYRNSIGILNACEQLLSIYNYTPKKETDLAPYFIGKVTNELLASMDEFLRVIPLEFKYENKLEQDVEIWIELKSFLLVLQNMLFNAFMHTNYTGAIALILQEEVEDGKHYCIITVVDNGKSEVYPIETIKAKVLETEEINATQVEIGYNMMEEIMVQHHGSILLKHQKGTGTKIQIKFPIDKAEFEQDKNIRFIAPIELAELLYCEPVIIPQLVNLEEDIFATEEQLAFVIPSRERKVVLIIEDNKDIRLCLKTLFAHDYDVLEAANGEEGVALAKQEIPDLIISDIMMPVMDGYECCKEIKADLSTCHIPVILLTAKVEDEDIIKGLEIGADDYILKPFAAPILKVKVKNLIENRINLRNTYAKLLAAPIEVESEEQEGATSNNAEIDDPFINTVVKIIEENIRESNFNVKKLASDLNMSQPTLYRKVKQSTGFTIIELIRGVRMRKAATLLKKKQYPVQEVAEMVGYNDIPTFRKHFIDTYRTTPSTYADSTTTS